MTPERRETLLADFGALTRRLNEIATGPCERTFGGGTKVPLEAQDLIVRRAAIAIALTEADADVSFTGWPK